MLKRTACGVSAALTSESSAYFSLQSRANNQLRHVQLERHDLLAMFLVKPRTWILFEGFSKGHSMTAIQNPTSILTMPPCLFFDRTAFRSFHVHKTLTLCQNRGQCLSQEQVLKMLQPSPTPSELRRIASKSLVMRIGIGIGENHSWTSASAKTSKMTCFLPAEVWTSVAWNLNRILAKVTRQTRKPRTM